MKVLFIYTDLFDFIPDYPGHYYIGVGSLAAVLKRADHEVSLIHVLKPWKDRSAFLSRVRAEDPDLIAFSSTTLQFSFIELMARWMHESHDRTPTICGGVHATISPDQAIAVQGIDMICRGEGEGAIVELCERLDMDEDIRSIQNLWVKSDGQVYRNSLRPLEDLDKLPYPDRDVFKNYRHLWWERNDTAVFMASRGCPHNCNYCCNKVLREVYDGSSKIVRFRNPDHLIGEIQDIRKRFPFIRSLNFDDDILFMRKDWSNEFLHRYKREVELPFYCNVRPGKLEPALVADLRKANCKEVRIGLESGNEHVRNSVLNRNISRSEIADTVALFRKHQISVRTFNMVGMPFENPRDVLDTIKINAELGIRDPQCTIFYPFPGTELYTLCQKNGFLTDRSLVDYYYDTVLCLPSLSRAQILMFHHYFDRFIRIYSHVLNLPEWTSKLLIPLFDSLFSHPSAPLAARIVRRFRHLFRKR